MASTWNITLRCGHAYNLPTGVPDLRTPYTGRHANMREPFKSAPGT